MDLVVTAPETAERVRHFGHASEAAHHRIEQLAQRHPRRFCQMRVYRRRGDALVAEKHLHDAGVHTAAAYGTEAVLGRAIKSVRRDEVVVTTKAPFSFSNPHSTPEGIVASLDKSLRQLDTSYV